MMVAIGHLMHYGKLLKLVVILKMVFILILTQYL